MSKDAQLVVEAMPIRLGEGHSEFSVQIRDPGIIRTAAWTLEKRLIMAQGGAQFDETLALFVEFAPNGPLRNRRFIVLATGQGISVPPDVSSHYIGSAVSTNTGRVAHVYELVKAAA